MNFKEEVQQELLREGKNTRRMLERVPFEKAR
jgi:hypothetical protein